MPSSIIKRTNNSIKNLTNCADDLEEQIQNEKVESLINAVGNGAREILVRSPPCPNIFPG